MTVFPDLGFFGVGVEIILSVDAHKIHQTDTNGVFGAEKRATGTEDAVPAEAKLFVFKRDVIRWASFYAKPALRAFFHVNAE